MGEKLEAVKRGWRRVWPFLIWVLAALAVAGGIWALIYVPKMQVPVCPPDQSGLPPKVCFDIENEARKTLAYIMGGLLAIIGITLAHRRIRALESQVLVGQEQLKVAQDQLQVAQEGQITERFTRSIEQLGSDKVAICLGGIYALERIANDSDKDYWTIIETLTAYVRENAHWQEPPLGSSEQPGERGSLHPATEIQAVLTVLGRRKYPYNREHEPQRLDLRHTDLRGAYLKDVHLEGSDLKGAHMEQAFLYKAHLERADLMDAHLEEAKLWEAHLEGADLSGAHLEGANLAGAQLDCAILTEANLERAKLHGAHLEWALFNGAHLEGAIFVVFSSDAKCWQAIGLTREQLAEAIIDDKTILPDYLQEQPPKAKGPEGNGEE